MPLLRWTDQFVTKKPQNLDVDCWLYEKKEKKKEVVLCFCVYLWSCCLSQKEEDTKTYIAPPQPASLENNPKRLWTLNSFVSRTTHRRPYLCVWGFVHMWQNTRVSEWQWERVSYCTFLPCLFGLVWFCVWFSRALASPDFSLGGGWHLCKSDINAVLVAPVWHVKMKDVLRWSNVCAYVSQNNIVNPSGIFLFRKKKKKKWSKMG